MRFLKLIMAFFPGLESMFLDQFLMQDEIGARRHLLPQIFKISGRRRRILPFSRLTGAGGQLFLAFIFRQLW